MKNWNVDNGNVLIPVVGVCFQVKDCIEKKIADIRMQPYVGTQEVREAEAASLRARARILDLERELDEITKRAIMTSTKAVQSAKQVILKW